MFAKKRNIYNEETKAQLENVWRGQAEIMQSRKEEEAAFTEHLDIIVDAFANFVSENDSNDFTEGHKILLFTILKAEGDLFQELREFDRAIKAYKALKNYCDQWNLQSCRLKVYEQIGMCYRTMRLHSAAVDYFKK